MTMATNRLGHIGEQIAARHLESLGYAIIERNRRVAIDGLRGEIDVIAVDGTTLVFCEVKTRRHSEHGDEALVAVTPRKQRQLRRLAGVYLSQLDAHAEVRFDVVAVVWQSGGGSPRVVHVAGAF